MSRIAFCLFIIAIFQNGIQANETSTEDLTKNTEKVLKVPVENPIKEEPKDGLAKDESAKDEADKDEPAKAKLTKAEPAIEKLAQVNNDEENEAPQKITDKPNESKTAETKEAPKTVTENTKGSGDASTKTTSTSTTAPSKPTLDFSDNILGPVMKARATIEDVVHKGVDGAKDIADGAYTFFKDTVTKLF